MKHLIGRLARIATLLAVAPAAGATPASLQPPQTNDDIQHAWGGEMRQVFSRAVVEGTATEQHTWVVGDGGVIRHRVDGGDWEIQDTPDTASQTLLDIYFLPNGKTGWACGTGGLLLHTTDGGDTWAERPRVCSSKCDGPMDAGELATLWRVRFLNPNRGFLCGLWTFYETFNGGASWRPVVLTDGGLGVAEDILFYEFYALEILQEGENWLAICAGQEWEEGSSWTCPAEYASPHEGGEAVVFRTDGGATAWEAVFSAKKYNDGPPPDGVLLQIADPWDFEFEPNPASLTAATGYLVGGSGTPFGTILRMSGGGDTWTREWGGVGEEPEVRELYGVATMTDGRVIACGYEGDIWFRKVGSLGNPSWVKKRAKDPTSNKPFSGPLGGAHAVGEAGFDSMVVGSWGFIAGAAIPSPSCQPCPIAWDALNDNAPKDNRGQFRFEAVAFLTEDEGYGVGQFEAILHTTTSGLADCQPPLDCEPGWTAVDGGPFSGASSTVLHSIAFDDAGARGVAVGNSGLVKTIDHSPESPPIVQRIELDPDYNLDAVTHAEGAVFWAAGFDKGTGNGLLLHSDDGGNTWSKPLIEVVFPSSPLSAVEFHDVTFLNAVQGFAVGWVPDETGPDDLDEPRAYKLLFDEPTGTLALQEVTPTASFPGGHGRIHAVESHGSSLSSADVYLAGGPHVLEKWSTGSASFQPVAGLPTCPPTCASGGHPTSCRLDFQAIGISPTGSTVLVSTEGLSHEHLAHELGFAYRFDGVAWERLRSRVNRDIVSISLPSDDVGHLVAHGSNRGSVPTWDEDSATGFSRPDIEKEWGSVGDSAVLRYHTE